MFWDLVVLQSIVILIGRALGKKLYNKVSYLLLHLEADQFKVNVCPGEAGMVG